MFWKLKVFSILECHMTSRTKLIGQMGFPPNVVVSAQAVIGQMVSQRTYFSSCCDWSDDFPISVVASALAVIGQIFFSMVDARGSQNTTGPLSHFPSNTFTKQFVAEGFVQRFADILFHSSLTVFVWELFYRWVEAM